MSTNWDSLCEFVAKNEFPTYYIFEDETGITGVSLLGSDDFGLKIVAIKRQPKYRVFAIKPTPIQEKKLKDLMTLGQWDKLDKYIKEEIKLKHLLDEQF